LRVIITKEANEQSTIILDWRVHWAREMIWVQTVAVGLIILLVAWVINEKSIWGGVTANTCSPRSKSLSLNIE
jgi:hypothetical protein